MPTLPTVTVTQTQADRMLAAYGSVAAYKQWLVKQIKEYVVYQEALKIDQTDLARAQQHEADKQAQLDALSASLEVTNP